MNAIRRLGIIHAFPGRRACLAASLPLLLLAAGGAARADDPPHPPAAPEAGQVETIHLDRAPAQQLQLPGVPAPEKRPVVTPRELATFGIVLGGLMAADRPAWKLFDTDLSLPAASRDQIGSQISHLGEGQNLILLSALPMLVDGKHGRQATTRAVKALITSAIAVQGLKFLVGEERPTQSGGHIVFAGPGSGHSSFPSGHAAASFAVATVMAHEYPKYRYLFWALAAAVALSRIQAGAHFPADVWAGAGLGIYMGRRAVRGNLNLLSWSF